MRDVFHKISAIAQKVLAHDALALPVLLPGAINKSKAAQALGLTRQQLYVRMRRYGLD